MVDVERWPLWGDRGCNMTIFLRGVRHVYCSCLLYAIIVIQSHAHTRNLSNVLNQNVNMTKWKGVRNICYKHCRQFMLTASEWMKHNQNTIAVINHRAIWIKFCDHSWLFCQLVKKKLAVVERLFWQLGTQFSGCCHCREVAIIEGSKQEPMYEQSTPKKWPS